jgi:hypothetical protein
MANTDEAYFVPLYNFIKSERIYEPSYDSDYYLNFISKTQNLDGLKNDSLELSYQKFTKHYQKHDNLLNIDYEWICYYVYVMLCVDKNVDKNIAEKKPDSVFFTEIQLSKLYENIMIKLFSSEFILKDKREKVLQIINKIKVMKSTPDIIDGWMEGDILSLMELMIELNVKKEDFAFFVESVYYSPLKSFKETIPYLLDKLDVEKKLSESSPYYKILRANGNLDWEKNLIFSEESIDVNNINKVTYECFHYPDEIRIKLEYNGLMFGTSIVTDDSKHLMKVCNYLSFLSQLGGLTKDEYDIKILNDNKIQLRLQNDNFILELIN